MSFLVHTYIMQLMVKNFLSMSLRLCIGIPEHYLGIPLTTVNTYSTHVYCHMHFSATKIKYNSYYLSCLDNMDFLVTCSLIVAY